MDSSTGKIVATQGRGNSVKASLNNEYSRRLLELHGKRRLFNMKDFDFHEEHRRLTDETPVATLPSFKQADLAALALDAQGGVSATVTVASPTGEEHTGTIGDMIYTPPSISSDTTDGNQRRGLQDDSQEAQEVVVGDTTYAVASSSNSEGCAIMEATEKGKQIPIYTVECCGDSDCNVYASSNGAEASQSRRLRLSGRNLMTTQRKLCSITSSDRGMCTEETSTCMWNGGSNCPNDCDCNNICTSWPNSNQFRYCLLPSKAECTLESECPVDTAGQRSDDCPINQLGQFAECRECTKTEYLTSGMASRRFYCEYFGNFQNTATWNLDYECLPESNIANTGICDDDYQCELYGRRNNREAGTCYPVDTYNPPYSTSQLETIQARNPDSRDWCTMESNCVQGGDPCLGIMQTCKSCDNIGGIADGDHDYCDCFSTMSTIVEKSKGQMLLKDLQVGDSVLASNGKYQPFVFSIHSNPSKPTSFVQIYTDSNQDAPFEATRSHLVFVSGNDAPIQVGKVKVGDELVGIDGPKTVTKVSDITRNGLYSPLTGDATLFVDGVLASSTSVYQGNEHVSFGPFQVNIHTLASWIGAPVMQAVCTKMARFSCDTQVDDGFGGTLNVWMGISKSIFMLPRVVQAIVFPSIIVLHVIGLLSYYATLFGLAALVGLGSIILKSKVKKNTKIN